MQRSAARSACAGLGVNRWDIWEQETPGLMIFPSSSSQKPLKLEVIDIFTPSLAESFTISLSVP